MSAKAATREFFLIPKHYTGGIPLYWRDDISGELARVVMIYLRREELTEVQLDLFKRYLEHFIKAPCWIGESELARLRKVVGKLKTVPEVDQFLKDCLKIGLDPL